MLSIPTVDQRDTQSLLLTGYPEHEASFHLLFVKDKRAAAGQLSLVPVTLGVHERAGPGQATHIAFTAEGLREIGLDEEVLGGFSRQFQQRMTPFHHRTLGDVGPNAPEPDLAKGCRGWSWGREAAVPHAILLVYAKKDPAGAAAAILNQLTAWTSQPLDPPMNLRAPDRPHLKEHFGFDDGIGNPVMRGQRDEDSALPHNVVAPGEFILGYLNEAGRMPISPHLSAGGRGGHVLPNGDFGRNGSYLVVRQLEQHVRAFWSFLLAQSNGKPDEAIRLASKMVGRWPNGAPMTVWSAYQPADEDPKRPRNDAFLYAADPDGNGCPIGAHVRRANPRDSVPQLDAQKSIQTSKQRRILRRGRTYGAPLPGALARGGPDPVQVARTPEDQDFGRGIHFLCLVSDLERQFEFIQQTWVGSRKFAGLGNDADPLLSNPYLPPDPPSPRASDFVIQRDGLNQRIVALPRFVTVRGSAYFFMPSGRAIQYLTGL
jgi:Dyp-type peroxidase family